MAKCAIPRWLTQPKIGTKVPGHSLVRLLIRSITPKLERKFFDVPESGFSESEQSLTSSFARSRRSFARSRRSLARSPTLRSFRRLNELILDKTYPRTMNAESLHIQRCQLTCCAREVRVNDFVRIRIQIHEHLENKFSRCLCISLWT